MRSPRFVRWGFLPMVLLLLAGVDAAYSQAFVSTDRTDYTTGDAVRVTGWGWEPGETVILTFNEDPSLHAPIVLSALADGGGMLANNDFLVAPDDAGVRFILQAVGQTSGMEAQTFFADAPWIIITWDPLVPGQNPNPIQPGEAATYSVRVQVQLGSPFQVAFSIVSGLPGGAGAAFSPDMLSFNGSTPYGTTQLTITTGAATPLGDYAVIFRAEKVGASGDRYDHIAVLSVRNTQVQLRPWLEIPPQQPNEGFGYSTTFISDFNADGHPDAVVGTLTAQIVNGIGHAYIYYGGPAADNVPDLVFASGIGGDRYGEWVIDAGDLNADAYSDLAVSACADNGDRGRVYVYFGGPGADNVADRILTGTSGGIESFGFVTARAGDVNGDGFEDLIVGAQTADNKGRAYVFYGGPGFDTTPDLTYYSPGPAGGFFGSLVTNAGDLNGDGLEDLAIGAPRINGSRTGQVIVYFGARPPDTTPDLTMSTNSPYDYFPGILQPGGDLNGDGYDDLVASNTAWPNEGTALGRCLVYFGGPGLDATPDLVLTGEASRDWFGNGYPVGDINGDGYGDLAVLAWGNDFGGPDIGRVYFYWGGPLLDAVPDLTLCGGWPGEGLGYIIGSPTADFNGDGILDFLIGALWNSEAGSQAGKAYMVSIITPSVTVSGLVSSDCHGPRPGVAVSLRDGIGGVHSTTTGLDGRYSLTSIPVGGTGTLSITIPEGYTAVSPPGGTTPVHLASDQIVDFSLACIPGYTPPGRNVRVTPVDSTSGTAPVTITFDSVTVAGVTTLVMSHQGPPPDSGFGVCTRPIYYEVTTTAQYVGTVTICIDYTEQGCKGKTKLSRYVGGQWVLLPATVDPVEEIICAQLSSLSLFAVFEQLLVPAVVDMDPDVLNPRSGGRWVTSYIELPEGYNPENIDVSTVLLNEAVRAEISPTSVGDHDNDGVPDRMVKFSRPAVINALPHGEYVEVRVSGQMGSETFAGKDTIRVLMPKVNHPNGGEMLTVGEECTIVWESPEGYHPGWYSIYYSVDDGKSWELVMGNVEGTSCAWTVPEASSTHCRVLVEAYDSKGIMGYDASDGTFIISLTTGVPSGGPVPARFALHPVSPNPFALTAVINFDLPEPRYVRLSIYDVRGRLVMNLIEGLRPASTNSVSWDGRYALGREAPAGVYFVRLEAGEHVATQKILLLK